MTGSAKAALGGGSKHRTSQRRWGVHEVKGGVGTNHRIETSKALVGHYPNLSDLRHHH